MIRLTSFLSMVSVCLPSDALLQHLPSYLGFSYLGSGVSLHFCSSKAQQLLLTLDEDSSSRPSCAAQPPLLGLLLLAAGPSLWLGVASQGHRPWPRARGGFSWPPLMSDAGCLLPAATGLGRGVAPPGHHPDLGRGVAPLGRS